MKDAQTTDTPLSEFVISHISSPGHPPGALAALLPADGQAILDCGLGDGVRARAIRERAPKARLTVAPFRIELPNDEHPADARCTTCFDDEAFCLEEASFDAVVCDGALAKLRDAESVMAQLALSLKPGGVALFTVPNLQHIDQVEMLAGGRWDLAEDGALARDHLRFFTAYEIAQLARRGGLEVSRCATFQSDAPERMPLDAEGYYRNGQLSLGPLTPGDQKLFLARTILLIATRPGA